MTRLLRRINVTALIGLMLLAATQTASAADPMSGKWELSIPNSMYDPGPAPKSGTRTQQVEGDSITASIEILGADGQSSTVHYTAKLDGADYPLHGAADADTISLKRIDARTLEYTAKKAGKVSRTGKHRVSEDGSELEISAKGKDAKGEEFEQLQVWEKR